MDGVRVTPVGLVLVDRLGERVEAEHLQMLGGKAVLSVRDRELPAAPVASARHDCAEAQPWYHVDVGVDQVLWPLSTRRRTLISMKRRPLGTSPDPVIDRLASEGRLRPASRDLRDVLAERGELRGPVTDAGTRALQEQRGERS